MFRGTVLPFGLDILRKIRKSFLNNRSMFGDLEHNSVTLLLY